MFPFRGLWARDPADGRAGGGVPPGQVPLSLHRPRCFHAEALQHASRTILALPGVLSPSTSVRARLLPVSSLPSLPSVPTTPWPPSRSAQTPSGSCTSPSLPPSLSLFPSLRGTPSAHVSALLAASGRFRGARALTATAPAPGGVWGPPRLQALPAAVAPRSRLQGLQDSRSLLWRGAQLCFVSGAGAVSTSLHPSVPPTLVQAAQSLAPDGRQPVPHRSGGSGPGGGTGRTHRHWGGSAGGGPLPQPVRPEAPGGRCPPRDVAPGTGSPGCIYLEPAEVSATPSPLWANAARGPVPG